MYNRAMQHITSENCNEVDLPIYLLQKCVDSVSSYFDKLLFAKLQELSTQREDIPTGSGKKYRLQKHLGITEKFAVVMVVAIF